MPTCARTFGTVYVIPLHTCRNLRSSGAPGRTGGWLLSGAPTAPADQTCAKATPHSCSVGGSEFHPRPLSGLGVARGRPDTHYLFGHSDGVMSMRFADHIGRLFACATAVVKVQQRSTATQASSTDLIRPTKARHLHQRPASTSMQLVHTEMVT